jgi:hypothetical protein
MAMPEAAMHEDDGPQATQHNVRPTRQVARVQTKPKAQRMHHPPDDKLGRGVATLDGSHAPRALLARQRVDAAANGRWTTTREHDANPLYAPTISTPNCMS